MAWNEVRVYFRADFGGVSNIGHVHAAYPTLAVEQLIHMTPQQVIASDPRSAQALNTTKRLRCSDSREFNKEVSKYVDSKDQKRGDKKVCICVQCPMHYIISCAGQEKKGSRGAGLLAPYQASKSLGQCRSALNWRRLV